MCLLVYAAALAQLVGAWFMRNDSVIALILACSGALTFLLGLAFHHLTVADMGDRLAIRFGPLPLFRRVVRYAEIDSVSVGRTLFLDGWGIHYSVRGGWVWNLWGRDCVVVQFKNRAVLRIGTDDAGNLARFMASKIAA